MNKPDELIERCAIASCASFRNMTVDQVKEDIEKFGADDILRLWRRIAHKVVDEVEDYFSDVEL